VFIDISGAAKLICLASKIRNSSGDEQILAELLVDYIERVGSLLLSELDDGKGASDSNILSELIALFEPKLVQDP